MGQNQTLDNRKCHQINHFEAILQEIGQIWPKFCYLIEKMLELGQNG